MRQKELFKEEIIHQLELHPSRLDKEKIISEAMEEGLDDFFEGIRMALDPLVTSVSYTHLTLPTTPYV